MPAVLDELTVLVRWLPVDKAKAADLDRYRGTLDPVERDRARRFVFERDRDLFTAAHALLRSTLSEVTGLPVTNWRFRTGEFGKPELADDPPGGPIQVSLAHTRGMAMCALARLPLGVDVERLDRLVDVDALKGQFALDEQRQLTAAAPADRTELFFRLWTLKEAYVKATGEGLSRPLKAFSFSFNPLAITFHGGPHQDEPSLWRFWDWKPSGRFAAALALRAPDARPMRLDAACVDPGVIG